MTREELREIHNGRKYHPDFVELMMKSGHDIDKIFSIPGTTMEKITITTAHVVWNDQQRVINRLRQTIGRYVNAKESLEEQSYENFLENEERRYVE